MIKKMEKLKTIHCMVNNSTLLICITIISFLTSCDKRSTCLQNTDDKMLLIKYVQSLKTNDSLKFGEVFRYDSLFILGTYFDHKGAQEFLTDVLKKDNYGCFNEELFEEHQERDLLFIYTKENEINYFFIPRNKVDFRLNDSTFKSIEKQEIFVYDKSNEGWRFFRRINSN